MKIGVDAREVKPNGAGKGRYASEVLKSLTKLDEKNEYFLYGFGRHTGLPPNFHWVTLPQGSGRWIFALPRLIRKNKINVFFSPTSFLACLLTFVPTVIVVHDLAVFVEPRAKPSFKTKLMEKSTLLLAIRRAKHIICDSNHTKKDVLKMFNVSEDKITVIHLAAFSKPKNIVGPKTITSKYNLPKRYILFVGTIEPRKNIEGLVKAYSLFPRAFRQAIPLVIVGKRGWNFENVDQMVEQLGLKNNVRFIGFIPDSELPGLYQSAGVVVYPSWYEGFGLPVLEAMSYGTPVITSNRSSLPEVVGDAAILINPEKPQEIAQAIKKVLSDSKFREILCHKGLQRAKEFSWVKTAATTLSVLLKVARRELK